MNLTITSGFGGVLQFQNFTPLAPSLVTENLSHFWDLPRLIQVDTLASAYQHLNGLQDASADVLESVGQMTQRLNDNTEASPVDHLVLGRLLLEWGRLKTSLHSSPPAARSDRPASSPAPAAAEMRPMTPVPPSGGAVIRRPTPTRSEDRRRMSGRHYLDRESGGFLPTSWGHLPDELRRTLKEQALGRSGRVSDLISSVETHAEFLVGVLAGWIESLATALTERGVKGAGQSGLASAPSVKPLLTNISQMTAWLGEPKQFKYPLGKLFWQGFGVNKKVRFEISQLTTQRSLLSSLEEAEREWLDRTLYALDGAHLAFVLEPLHDPETASSDPGRRDEAYGDRIAEKFKEQLVDLPLSDRSAFGPDQQVALMGCLSILRLIGQEVRADPSAPAAKGFLKRLQSSDILDLPRVVALIQAH